MQFSKIVLWGALVCLALPVAANAKALPNRMKTLHTEMKDCEVKAKHFADLGYPEKAEKQLLQCKKIKSEISKIKTAQEKVGRKIASLNEKPSKKKKTGKSKKNKKTNYSADEATSGQ